MTGSEFIIIASAYVYTDWLVHVLAPFADPQVALSYGKQRGNPAAHFSEQQSSNIAIPTSLNPDGRIPSATPPTQPSAGHYGRNILTMRP